MGATLNERLLEAAWQFEGAAHAEQRQAHEFRRNMKRPPDTLSLGRFSPHAALLHEAAKAVEYMEDHDAAQT